MGADLISPPALNTLGILVALAGVITLFRYGMPFKVKTGGVTYIVTEVIDKNELRQEARYARYGYLGLGAVVAGTALQIASIWL
jgi:hypothetical protein